MNLKTTIATVALGTVGAAAFVPPASADPFLPVPPGSFINYHVATSKALSEEVARDVVVRARLARHFHMSAPAVYEYVRQNLVTAHLTSQQAGVYQVACIGPGGREYFVRERLKAGTAVFALASTGQPVLKLACGNPLTASLPVVEARQPPALASDPTAMPQPTMVATSLIPDALPFTSGDLSDEFDGIGPITNVGGFTQVLSSGGNGGLFAGLLGAAALIGVTTGGHNGGGNTPTPPPTPAPEPGQAAVLALGTVGLAGLSVLARRRGAPSAD